jgi:hypothetical protein
MLASRIRRLRHGPPTFDMSEHEDGVTPDRDDAICVVGCTDEALGTSAHRPNVVTATPPTKYCLTVRHPPETGCRHCDGKKAPRHRVF